MESVTKLPIEGEVLLGVEISKDNGFDAILFNCIDKQFKMYYEPECCAVAELVETIGDWNDLLGQEITTAEERCRRATENECSESGTWTFYEIASPLGSVTLRWLGESNGYYSESISFELTDEKPDVLFLTTIGIG